MKNVWVWSRLGTLMTWSLGRRLQSASVSSSPSRYFRLDSPAWSSSGSGLSRYSSSLAKALLRPVSNAKHPQNTHPAQNKNKMFVNMHSHWISTQAAYPDVCLAACSSRKLRTLQTCRSPQSWTDGSSLRVWDTLATHVSMALARKLLKPLLVSGREQAGAGLLWWR